jgi:hypothetical protein
VDDILIFGTNMKVINELKSFVSNRFDIKDLGEVDVILNIKILKNENEITLMQSASTLLAVLFIHFGIFIVGVGFLVMALVLGFWQWR